MLLPGGAASTSYCGCPVTAKLRLPPADWRPCSCRLQPGGNVTAAVLLPGSVGVGSAAACSPAMLQPAGKISFSPCPLDFPIPRRRSLSSFIPSVSDSATVAVYV